MSEKNCNNCLHLQVPGNKPPCASCSGPQYPNWEPVQGTWIDWAGGTCPLPADTRVSIRLRSGDEDDARAGDLEWNAGESLSAIVAYRTPFPVPIAQPTALSVQEGGDHYKSLPIQPVEYIHKNGIGYFEGNVIKYVTRWRAKNGVADLKKARHYIDLLIELEGKS